MAGDSTAQIATYANITSTATGLKKLPRASSQLEQELRSDCQEAHASADMTMSTLN